jgi:hypothetical protein
MARLLALSRTLYSDSSTGDISTPPPRRVAHLILLETTVEKLRECVALSLADRPFRLR